MPLPKPKKKKLMSATAVAERRAARLAAATAVVEDNIDDSNILQIDGSVIEGRVDKLLKHAAFVPTDRYWLDTGSPELNAVLGARDFGIPYGKVIELGGPEHTGKTLIATILMGMAQRDSAGCGYIDLEDSRDEKWATKLGVVWPYVTKFWPRMMLGKAADDAANASAKLNAALKKKKKSGAPVLQTAESICEEAEKAMELLASHGARKQFWFMDSIANILTAKQFDVGLQGSSMNSKLDRAMFLSTLLPRWAGLAANYNAMIVVSNQLRSKIGGFIIPGAEDETTGGRALRHACAVRTRTRRVKGGRLKQGSKIIGLAGALRNIKNKAGEGSEEGHDCGFKILWNRDKASVAFMTVDDLKSEMGE